MGRMRGGVPQTPAVAIAAAGQRSEDGRAATADTDDTADTGDADPISDDTAIDSADESVDTDALESDDDEPLPTVIRFRDAIATR